MTARDATTAFATALVDEWARAGITEAVVAPGSRSAPLALALARDRRFRLHVVLDERSASFRALGTALATGRPALCVCTSGTAAANFHPAVVEAHHARVPLIVCTADRPPELRDAGAGQTIDQTHLFGGVVRWFHDPGPPADVPGAGAIWRAIACRAVAEATGPPAGPVHLNLPFREPLVPTGDPLVDAPGREDGAPWTATFVVRRSPSPELVARLAAQIRACTRGLVVAGWGAGVSAETVERCAAAAGWPVLADPISGVRSGSHTISTYEALLREQAFADAHRPELVLHVGAPLTSKFATAWLDPSIARVLVDPDRAWLDPGHGAHQRVEADAELLLAALADELDHPEDPTPWLREWRAAEAAARAAIDRVLDESPEAFEGRIARDVVRALPDGSALVVASSLPVRALEWCMEPREAIRVLSNRGANGIDGFVSTAIGVALAAASRTTVALCGDLCFLHDTNGLLGATSTGANVTLVVIDNDGGGIFSFLPQAPLPEFETLFGTPHGLDLVAVARAHGVEAERIDDITKLPAALTDARTSPGVHILVVPVNRSTTVARHRALWDAVATALGRR